MTSSYDAELQCIQKIMLVRKKYRNAKTLMEVIQFGICIKTAHQQQNKNVLISYEPTNIFVESIYAKDDTVIVCTPIMTTQYREMSNKIFI